MFYVLLLTSLKRGVRGSFKIVATTSLHGYVTTSTDSVRIAVSPLTKTIGSRDDDNDNGVIAAVAALVRASNGSDAQFEKHCLCHATHVSRGAQKDV